MEAVRQPKKKKGKGKKKGDESERPSSASKPKIQQVLPNPDEVIEIERPGSATSLQSKPELFAADAGTTSGSGDRASTPAEERGRPASVDKVRTTAGRTASPSILPFRSSQVTPVNGSLASVRSKEAWGGVDPKESGSRTIPKLDDTISVVSKVEDTTAVRAESNQGSSTDVSLPKVKDEGQAYVPYLFARDTVVRIVNDMHKMKDSHVNVVNQIELNYKMIEDETQRQFNSFVLNLRNVYKDKLTIFQHVISIHRKDTEVKKEYWDSNLTELSARNKKLLADKKALLIQNKLLLDRLGVVKGEATRDLILQLDDVNHRLSSERESHKEDTERWEKEKHELLEEMERLREKTSVITPAVVPVVGSAVEDDSRQTEPEIITKEVIVDMSEQERAELDGERERMKADMADITLQRENLLKEREEFGESRKLHLEEKNNLQLKINELEKGMAEWKQKYDITRTQLSQFGALQGDYDILLAAYNATVIAASSAGQGDEKVEKSKADKVALEEDRNGLQKDIDTWEKDYRQRTGKEPTEDDMPDSIKEYKVMYTETDNAIKKLDVEIETIEKLRSGQAPSPPERSAEGEKAVSLAEPIIRTVEVPVPDPEVAAKLQASEEKNDKLQKENTNLQTKINDLQTEISELKSRISVLEGKLRKAEAENASSSKTIHTLTNKLREESKALAEARGAAVAGVSPPASDTPTEPDVEVTVAAGAVAVGAVAADHADCERRSQELQEKIQKLEAQMESAELGIAYGEDHSEKIEELERQLDQLEEKLRKEEAEHSDTREELDDARKKVAELEEQLEADKKGHDESVSTATVALSAQLAQKEKELKDAQTCVGDLEAKLMANVPVEAAGEMKTLLKKIAGLKKENDGLSKKSTELDGKAQALDAEKKILQKSLEKEKSTNTASQAKLKAAKAEKEAELGKLTAQWEQKEKARVADNKAKVESLNKKIKELEARPAAGARARPTTAAGDSKAQKQVAVLTEQLQDKKKDIKELQAKVAQLQEDVKKAKTEGGTDLKEQKKQKKILEEMSKKLDLETRKAERDGAKVKELQAEMAALTKDRDSKEAEIKKLQTDINQLGVTAAQAIELGDQVKTLEEEVKHLKKETNRLTEAYNTERVQRKKYFNMVEDMKGKIRVFCRARPMSGDELTRGNFSVLKSPDEYSINVESSRGLKEFNFDRVFMPENTQEQVFEDTYHLVQSAVDGYNVCIFAYGQTGSGKTYTMIGGGPSAAGIAPRAFKRIFEVIEENKEKFDFRVSSYMLELYNDKLLDLYTKDGGSDEKMEIKKDKAGLVFVRGSNVKEAPTEESLSNLFEIGSKNRHTASTKMNAESSRSHLILSVIIESTNKTNGQVTRGKLSLVDLAGSERVGKTGATAETLKEANSINKSLAALGDVISALSSDQQFIPYRNNKLTMLMQDSLGGNAKTLMFVNISPADYNADETITSLAYASRVKLITNDAQKNSDNKEIARLKDVITKLKAGQSIDEDLEV